MSLFPPCYVINQFISLFIITSQSLNKQKCIGQFNSFLFYFEKKNNTPNSTINKEGSFLLISEPTHNFKHILPFNTPNTTVLNSSNLVGLDKTTQSIITLILNNVSCCCFSLMGGGVSQKGSWRFFTRRKQVDSPLQNTTKPLLAKELSVSHLIAIGTNSFNSAQKVWFFLSFFHLGFFQFCFETWQNCIVYVFMYFRFDPFFFFFIQKEKWCLDIKNLLSKTASSVLFFVFFWSVCKVQKVKSVRYRDKQIRCQMVFFFNFYFWLLMLSAFKIFPPFA